MRIRDASIFITAAFFVLGGCGADRPLPPDEAVVGPGTPSSAPSAPPSSELPPENRPAPASSPPPEEKKPESALDLSKVTCATPPPATAKKALALPTYKGTCPTLAVPPAMTTLTSSGAERELLVYRPTTIGKDERLPVVFLWHWLGGSAAGMGGTLEAQAAVEKHRFIAVVPSTKGDTFFKWPFEEIQPQSRVDEEASFFDDMLACVAAALPVDKECVSSMGVSAGALWTAQLAVARSERIASIVSLSGGVGEGVRPWKTTPHRLPALVLWGGEDDVYPEKLPVLNFEKASKNLEGALSKDGHFVVECTHACGHQVPPFEVPASGGSRFDPIWRFLLDHPYWLEPGSSPYAASFPSALPKWCASGVGKATAATSCSY